jgi:LytS/YehU family sensor histidine kinase
MLYIKGMFLAGLIILIWYYWNGTIERQKTIVEVEQLKKENLEAQLNSLKQQISPHFLFNSLSTLQTIVPNESAKEFIAKLSEVYRYLLSNSENHLVSLREELDFSQSFLYILKERFEDGLLVTLTIDPAVLDLQIPPFSLQLLIENAIKHNSISFEEPLQISISNDNDKNIVVWNNLQPKISVEKSTKIGLENIQKRYLLLSKKEIEIFKNGTQFLVKLPLLDSLN